MTSLEILTAAGEAMFGEGWRGGMAIALGPYPPQGPRASIDRRLVSRWSNGWDEIEQWAIDALPAVLAAEATRRMSEADELYEDAAELRRLACKFTLAEEVA